MEGPAGSEELRVAATFSNEFFGLSNPPSWCSGLESRSGGQSEGPGSGTIGPFTFSSRWCMDSGALRSEDGSFETEAGKILLAETTRTVGEPGVLEAVVRTRLGPPLEFEGEFTVRGGTGACAGATGTARLVGRQLGGGRTAMAACGYILTPTVE